MSQRTKSEGSTGLLGGFPGILGAIAFGLVFSFGLGNGLPSHVVFGVTPAAFKWHGVVNHIIFAWPRGTSSSRTGVGQSKLVLGAVGSQDSAMTVTRTRLTSLTSESRTQQ